MELFYFIQVISTLLSILKFNDVMCARHNSIKNQMKGGVKLGALSKLSQKTTGNLKGNLDKRVVEESRKNIEFDKLRSIKMGPVGDQIKKSFYGEGMQDRLQGLSGLKSSFERKKAYDTRMLLYNITTFLSYLVAILTLPLMPFYASTRSFFKKSIPFFKEVVIPESIKTEEEKELEKIKELKNK